MLNQVRHILGKRATRITAAALTVLGLAWLLWPSKEWELQLDRLVAFLVPLVTWTAAEAHLMVEPHPHDLVLMARFRNLITDEDRRFYREHPFGSGHDRAHTTNLLELARDWRGAAFEFEDKRLNEKLSEVINAAAKLADDLGVHAYAVHGNPERMTLKSDNMQLPGAQARFEANAARIDGKAAKLSELVDEFERLARKRLHSA